MENTMQYKKQKEELSKYGIELENGISTLRITARCVLQADDTNGYDDNGRKLIIKGFWDNGFGDCGLVGKLRCYSFHAMQNYVVNPSYQEELYASAIQSEPALEDDRYSDGTGDDTDMDETEYLPEPAVLGLSFGFHAAEEVVVDEDNPYFTARDGVLFSKDMTRLIWYPYGKQDQTYTVPYGVTEISPWAFAGLPRQIQAKRVDGSDVCEGNKSYHFTKYIYHKKLNCVILPDTVTVIRGNAFNHCLSLQSVRLSSTLKEIRYNAFHACKDLRSIELPDSLEYMDDSFDHGYYLETVRFLGTRRQISRPWEMYSHSGKTVTLGPDPYSLKYLEDLFYCLIHDVGNHSPRFDMGKPKIFFDDPWFILEDGVVLSLDRTELLRCDRTKSGSYTVPYTVTRIGEKAFDGCTELTQINISHPETDIGTEAFSRCKSLEQVTFQGLGSVKSIGDMAFKACVNLKKIPLSKVESIGNYAFSGCVDLTKISLAKVKSIGNGAFYDCRNLTKVSLSDGVESIAVNAFAGCDAIKDLPPWLVTAWKFGGGRHDCKIIKRTTNP